jgi:hypothetical protein
MLVLAALSAVALTFASIAGAQPRPAPGLRQ